MTTATACKKCNVTLTSYDASFCQGYCKSCYNGTPLEDGEDNGMTPCDDCEAEIADELYEANDGRCEACRLEYAASHFTCEECSEELEIADRSTTCSTRCQSCQDTIDEEAATEALDAARDEARELFEELIETEDLDDVVKLVKALKRLAK